MLSNHEKVYIKRIIFKFHKIGVLNVNREGKCTPKRGTKNAVKKQVFFCYYSISCVAKLV